MVALLRGMLSTQPLHITHGRRLVALAAVVVLALLGLLSAGAPAHAQSPTSGLHGTWKNVDADTSSITKVKVAPSLLGLVAVRAWAQCQPSDCDWGQVAGFSSAPGTVVAHFVHTNDWGIPYAVRDLTLTLRPDGDANYRVATDFVDPFRADYVKKGRLTKV